MLFDSHAHYNDERFKDDVDEVLSAMNENRYIFIRKGKGDTAEKLADKN